jgi:penicillin V acylase-like amidase (Ntn superfamily)
VWNNNGKAVLVGRSTDWLNPMWTAKYGTLAAVPSRGTVSGAADGINEKGLTGSLLWLVESD